MMVWLGAASPRGLDATCTFRMSQACAWRRAPESGSIDTMRAKAANHHRVAIVVYDGVSLFELGVACDVFGDDSGGGPPVAPSGCGGPPAPPPRARPRAGGPGGPGGGPEGRRGVGGARRL